jgi:hypothetical protein
LQWGDFIGPQEDDDFFADADFLGAAFFAFEPDVLAMWYHLLPLRSSDLRSDVG